MDIKLKKYSHSIITKIVVFIIAIICFTGIVQAFVEVEIVNDGDFGIITEDNYFREQAYVQESESI